MLAWLFGQVMIVMAGFVTIIALVSWRQRGKRLRALREEVEALRMELARVEELSMCRQRNWEREMVRSGALARANEELAEKIQRLQAERNLLMGRGKIGFMPLTSVVYLN